MERSTRMAPARIKQQARGAFPIPQPASSLRTKRGSPLGNAALVEAKASLVKARAQ
jgi:hypothetical protein